MMTADEVKRNYRKHKAALTRAINSKDPYRVIAAVNLATADFDDYPGGWPDDWHRWDRAFHDALRALARGEDPR